jgi:hypothetical protein
VPGCPEESNSKQFLDRRRRVVMTCWKDTQLKKLNGYRCIIAGRIETSHTAIKNFQNRNYNQQ